MQRGRVILLPGLGADERLFGSIGDVCRVKVTPRLLVPEAGETMPDYARRTAQRLAIEPADVIGGCSFGALVATEIARQRPVTGLILLAGALSSRAISPLIRVLGPLLLLMNSAKLVRAAAWGPALGWLFGPLRKNDALLLQTMLAETTGTLLMRAGRLAVSYEPRVPLTCAVHALHGGRDRFMRPPEVSDCTLLPYAGHALPLTHGAQVTEFLRRRLCE